MSTRARIGVQFESGEIKSVYVWRDGTPCVLGEILGKYYDTLEKATALVERGNLIDVEVTLAECNFEQASSGDVAPQIHKTFAAYMRESECDIRYKYIFRDGKWGYWGIGE
nr:MAG TPA: hypothetical protein [Caudoviricetes sp.]